MHRRLWLVVVVLMLVSAAPAKPATAERRIALVFGNSAYQAASALRNPTNDAKGVAEALRNAGFNSVRVVNDATHDSMIQVLRTFQDEADTAEWAVVYYAGHGIEIGGVNYLVPTDARLKVDRDAQDEAVSLNRVLDAVAGAKKLKLVMLDACRDNPFARQMRRTIATRAVSRGLTSIEPEGATLVVYAAKDGEVAEDGGGDHSPFTAALMKRLQQPGVEINRLFRLVTGDVLQATGNHQRPFVYGSIPGEEEFYFRVPDHNPSPIYTPPSQPPPIIMYRPPPPPPRVVNRPPPPPQVVNRPPPPRRVIAPEANGTCQIVSGQEVCK